MVLSPVQRAGQPVPGVLKLVVASKLPTILMVTSVKKKVGHFPLDWRFELLGDVIKSIFRT